MYMYSVPNAIVLCFIVASAYVFSNAGLQLKTEYFHCTVQYFIGNHAKTRGHLHSFRSKAFKNNRPFSKNVTVKHEN